MLSEKLGQMLNQQINMEFYSSNLYLQMSAWCQSKGLEGCAAFLRRHAGEEMMHMQKMFDFVNESGRMALVGAIEAPTATFESPAALFQAAFEHEQQVTASIGQLVEASMAERDFSTLNFLQWFVSEQHEEEALYRNILDKFELIGTSGQGLFFIDREIAQLAVGAGDPGTPAT
ncbi:MAG: non-heme ferritin [Calditrichaeota bacterium]|nr:non-heme ferritin [Candidatus Cloacimonadota bacterium]MCA9786381.1 non-heme ferritin [Candidatus Cloacimonadota bacterium]MCB1046864.1 non-heme ferritin [Calditrichota bacterium]MCB9472998.1 non-heme ferritin [Candidatus Delongbacteria bacterium]